MPGGGSGSRLCERDQVVISNGVFEYIPGRVPGAVCCFTEIPRMALAAGKITPGLVDRKIIFRPRQVHAGDQTRDLLVLILQRRLTGQSLTSVHLHQAATR